MQELHRIRPDLESFFLELTGGPSTSTPSRRRRRDAPASGSSSTASGRAARSCCWPWARCFVAVVLAVTAYQTRPLTRRRPRRDAAAQADLASSDSVSRATSPTASRTRRPTSAATRRRATARGLRPGHRRLLPPPALDLAPTRRAADPGHRVRPGPGAGRADDHRRLHLRRCRLVVGLDDQPAALRATTRSGVWLAKAGAVVLGARRGRAGGARRLLADARAGGAVPRHRRCRRRPTDRRLAHRPRRRACMGAALGGFALTMVFRAHRRPRSRCCSSTASPARSWSGCCPSRGAAASRSATTSSAWLATARRYFDPSIDCEPGRRAAPCR